MKHPKVLKSVTERIPDPRAQLISAVTLILCLVWWTEEIGKVLCFTPSMCVPFHFCCSGGNIWSKQRIFGIKKPQLVQPPISLRFHRALNLNFFILTQQIPSCTSWQPGLLSLCVVTELRGEGTKWEFCISFKAGHGWMWDGVKSCPAPERELSSPGMTGCGLGYLTALTQIWVICATSQTHSQSSSFHELIKINPKNVCSPSSATNRDFWLLSCLCHSGRKKAEFSKIWEKTEPSLAGH